jgi:S-adenosylmethionine hydrolase
MPPIVTLTTDFGLRDPYVAEMKGVILSISPDATIVDLTHEIEKFDVRMAAYTLACATPCFPEGTVHVAVVDPQVGTRRRPLLIQTLKSFYVGPDNGILAIAVNMQGIEHIFEITNRKLMLPRISNTFHGRDIFAPAAAHLANGTRPVEFGPELRRISTPGFAKTFRKKGMLLGEVLHVDGFGNIITNFTEKDLGSTNMKENVDVKLKTRRLSLRLCRAYAEVEKQQPLAVIGSHSFLEISVNQGNAAKAFKIKRGDRLALFGP